MFDGTYLPAMEVYPGKQVLSFGYKRITRAQVRDRKIENQQDVICILLSNGQKLTGSRDQMVAVYRSKSVRFTPMADVAIGDRLRGERAGVPIVVGVIGLAFEPRREVRLVGLDIDNKTFVAESVLCR